MKEKKVRPILEAKKLQFLLDETGMPLTEAAKACDCSSHLLYYYLKQGLTNEQRIRLKQWAQDISKEFEAFGKFL